MTEPRLRACVVCGADTAWVCLRCLGQGVKEQSRPEALVFVCVAHVQEHTESHDKGDA